LRERRLDDAVGGDLDIRRLEIAMMIPFSCAASTASAICRATVKASSSDIGACESRSASVGEFRTVRAARRIDWNRCAAELCGGSVLRFAPSHDALRASCDG